MMNTVDDINICFGSSTISLPTEAVPCRGNRSDILGIPDGWVFTDLSHHDLVSYLSERSQVPYLRQLRPTRLTPHSGPQIDRPASCYYGPIRTKIPIPGTRYRTTAVYKIFFYPSYSGIPK